MIYIGANYLRETAHRDGKFGEMKSNAISKYINYGQEGGLKMNYLCKECAEHLNVNGVRVVNALGIKSCALCCGKEDNLLSVNEIIFDILKKPEKGIVKEESEKNGEENTKEKEQDCLFVPDSIKIKLKSIKKEHFLLEKTLSESSLEAERVISFVESYLNDIEFKKKVKVDIDSGRIKIGWTQQKKDVWGITLLGLVEAGKEVARDLIIMDGSRKLKIKVSKEIKTLLDKIESDIETNKNNFSIA